MPGLVDDLVAFVARDDIPPIAMAAIAHAQLETLHPFGEQVIEVPSKSRPGEVNVVRITAGVATCSCKGFEYRGDCSHARQAAKEAAA